MLVDVVKMKIVKNLFLIVLLISFFMSLGCIGKNEGQKNLSEEDITQMVRQTPVVIGEEKIGGIYNASILTVRTEYKGKEQKWQQIEYTKVNKTIRDDFVPDIRKSLDWIKLNTSEDVTILGWWDYGNSIRGYTGREVVIDFLSRELLDTISSYKYMTPEQQREMDAKLVPLEKVADVSKVLTAKDSQDAIRIMKKYNASYLFVHSSNDVRISHIFFSILGMTPLEPNSGEFGTTIIGKASRGKEIDGFKLVYSDANVKLYNVI
jgi:asparagine N-glycosylation enzyme membrane subunit Stt3